MGASCIRPGAIGPEDLVAYVDGDASADVTKHVAACAFCAAEAESYADLQHRLERHLYRCECPSAHILGEFELGVLALEPRSLVVTHLVQCPRCRDELAGLRGFLDTEPGQVKARMAGPVRRIVAGLLAPLSPSLAASSLRGADDAALLAYGAGNVRITLSIERLWGGTVNLVGLLWREDGTAADMSGTATLTSSKPGTRAVEVDDLGNFTFDAITPGSYHLEIAAGDQRIVIEDLLLTTA